MWRIIMGIGIVVIIGFTYYRSAGSGAETFPIVSGKEESTSLETNDVNFQKDVIESPIPVLVDFWAPWCGPCRMVTPVMHELGNKVTGKARIYKLNVDKNPKIARQFGVFSIPTVIAFKGGKVTQTLVGVQTEEVYLNALGLN